jgi:hypothetical protein
VPGESLLAESTIAAWKETADKRSTQMIFGDMGVNETPWSWSAYDEVIEKLTAAGIPRQEIACIGDADSDTKKKALFDKVRSGQVRVLIGSTWHQGMSRRSPGRGGTWRSPKPSSMDTGADRDRRSRTSGIWRS